MSIDDVTERFRKSLIIPETKPEKQFFLCPIGLVGAGKTTVMKPLCEALGLLRISNDEFREMLKEEGHGWEHLTEMVLEIAREYAKEGYSIGIDADCADHDKRAAIEKFAQEHAIAVLYIHINPPEEFIINKLMHYKHTWLFKDGTQAVENYRNRKKLHEGLMLPYVYTFDTSRSDVNEQIQEAIGKIRASL